MISSIWFDGAVVLPFGKGHGEGVPRGELRDTNFHASEGFRILEGQRGEFTIWCEGMPAAVTIGGYGYSYVKAPTPDVGVSDDQAGSEVQALEAPPEPATGKRRKR